MTKMTMTEANFCTLGRSYWSQFPAKFNAAKDYSLAFERLFVHSGGSKIQAYFAFDRAEQIPSSPTA